MRLRIPTHIQLNVAEIKNTLPKLDVPGPVALGGRVEVAAADLVVVLAPAKGPELGARALPVDLAEAAGPGDCHRELGLLRGRRG